MLRWYCRYAGLKPGATLFRLIIGRKRRLFQIRGDSNDAAHQRAHPGDGQGGLQARLEIEMRGINAYGRKPSDHAIGSSGDCCSQKAFGPEFEVMRHVCLENAHCGSNGIYGNAAPAVFRDGRFGANPKRAALVRSKIALQVLHTATPGFTFSPQPGHSTVSRAW